MKKLILSFLVLCLILCSCALAETDESISAVQMDWSEEAEQAFVEAGYSGT